MENYNLMGIVIGNRKTFAPDVQEVLTRFGKIIKMRIGLHEDSLENTNEGFIILNLYNDDNKIVELAKELEDIDTVRVKNIKL